MPLVQDGGHVVVRALALEEDGQWKKWRPKRTWKKQDDEKRMKVAMSREDVL